MLSYTGEIFRIRDKFGNDLQISDLKHGQVMNIRVSDAGYAIFYDITVTEDTITGVVVESWNETIYPAQEMETTFRLIDNTKLQLLPQLRGLNIGETIEAKIAVNGKIISYKRLAKYWNCGVITANAVVDGAIPMYQLKILDDEGNIKLYSFARRINGNSENYDGSDFYEKYKPGSFVVYTQNSYTEIKYIAVIGADDYVLTNIDETMSGKAFSALYDYDAGTFYKFSHPQETYRFTDRSVVFAYEFDSISDNATDIKDNLIVGTEALIKPPKIENVLFFKKSYNGFIIYNDSKEIEAVFLFKVWDLNEVATGWGITPATCDLISPPPILRRGKSLNRYINWDSYPMEITKPTTITVDGETRNNQSGYIDGNDDAIIIPDDNDIDLLGN